MSKYNLERELRRELEVVNDIIDKKIIRGMSYAREARRHKFILSNLSSLRKGETKSGWFGRSLSTFSII
ncbi:MAG TPA: hypothetical protein VJG67_03715 [Candidatus Paceibacterota bacterium]